MKADFVKELETAMWEAAKNRNRTDFLNLVDENAVMVCGGFKCSGREYANIIEDFDLADYGISDFEIVAQTETIVQVHYSIETKVCDKKNSDLAGKFNITSTWKNSNRKWKLVFNMDSRIF